MSKKLTQKQQSYQDERAWKAYKKWYNTEHYTSRAKTTKVSNASKIRAGQDFYQFTDADGNTTKLSEKRAKERFLEAYHQIHSVQQIKDEQMYQMSDKTVRNFMKVYKEANPKAKANYQELRGKSTQELADLMRDSIKEDIEDMRKAGYTKEQQRKMISQYYFGS